MKKTFLILGVGLLILIVAFVIALGFYIGPIVKLGMLQIGPKITQVSIKVDAVDISILTGSAQVKGLIVGNPEGFKMPQAISVGTVALSVDPLSVLSGKILVRSLHVESPEITFEGGFGSNNLSQIMDNVNTFSKNVVPASSNYSSGSNNKPAPKIEVDDLLITGAQVHVRLTGLVSKAMTVTLPQIHLTGLGKDSNGLTPSQLTSAVLSAIDSSTIKAVTASVTQLGQGVEILGKGAGKAVGSTVNSILNSIGGL